MTKHRIAVTCTALGLAAASATGGALLSGGAPAGAAAKTATTAKAAKHGGHGKARAGRIELRKDIRAALKKARGGKREPLTPQAVQAVVAPVVRDALAKGTVKQAFVDRRAARFAAMAKAFGG